MSTPSIPEQGPGRAALPEESVPDDLATVPVWTLPAFARGRVATVAVLVAITLVVALLTRSIILAGWYRQLQTTTAVGDLTPAEIDRRATSLEKSVERLRPHGVYLVIDSLQNRMRVFRNAELVREAVISTGSGALLTDPRNGRNWTFDTPLGEHRVQRKVRNPIWIKPDWAFIEEGETPPAPRDLESRMDDVSLGAYSLYLGDGYMLHGTLFQTLLGKGVTHGCIRVGDADLEFLYKNVPVGARVYIY